MLGDSGFVAYDWIDAGNGIMASMTVYKDRASAESANEKAAAWVRESAQDLYTNPPEVTHGEVGVHG